MSDFIIYASLFISLYFEVFLLITFFEGESKSIDTAKSTNLYTPSVTVIVPCWNEENTIAGTLNSLLKLKYQKNKLDIIVVDDGSTDNTLAVAKSFAHNEQVRVFTKENGGKHSAMNFALSKTDSEIVGCLDADSFVDPDAMLNLVQHFKDESIASVTPSIKIHNAKGILQIIQKAEYGVSVFLRKVFVALDAQFITPGPFSFFRRTALDKIGYWQNAHMTEDLEIGLRMQKHHMRVENEPSAVVYTTAPATLHALHKQRVRWTYGFLRNAWDYRFMFFNKEYGNLGLIILPMAVVSVFVGIYITLFAVVTVLSSITEKIIQISEVGLTFHMPTFDIFYVNTATITIITFVVIIGTFVTMALGKRLTKDDVFTADSVAYLALYGFIAPLWLTSATAKALSGIKINWR